MNMIRSTFITILILFFLSLLIISTVTYRYLINRYSLLEVPEEVYNENKKFLEDIMDIKNAVPIERVLGDFDSWYVVHFSKMGEYYWLKYKTEDNENFSLITDYITLKVIQYDGPPLGRFSKLGKNLRTIKEGGEIFHLLSPIMDYLGLRNDKELYSIEISSGDICISGGMIFLDLWPKGILKKRNRFPIPDTKSEDISKDVLYGTPFRFNCNDKKIFFHCSFVDVWRLGYQELYPNF